MISLVWTRAGISVAIGLMAVGAIGGSSVQSIRTQLSLHPLLLSWPIWWLAYSVIEWISLGWQFPSMSWGTIALCVIPLILLCGPRLTAKEWSYARNVFTSSLGMALFVGLALGGVEAIMKDVAFSSQVTYIALAEPLGQHPTYLSMLIGICLFWWITDRGINTKPVYKLLIGGMLGLFLGLLNARMQLLLLGGILGVAACLWFWKHKRHLIPSGVLSAVLLLIASYAVLPSNAQQRIADIWQSQEHTPHDEIRSNSKAVRLYIWEAATDLIALQPLWGYGIVDAQAALNQAYLADQVPVENFNSHHQLFQTWLELGALGSIGLIVIAGLFFFRAFLRQDWLLGMTVLFCVLSGLSEVVLSRQLGVSIVAFFWPLFVLNQPPKDKA